MKREHVHENRCCHENDECIFTDENWGKKCDICKDNMLLDRRNDLKERT